MPRPVRPPRSLIYRTYSLDAKDERITRALIVVHGQGRDADNYFRTTLAAAFLAGALEDTVVVAPRFASTAVTANNPKLTSYDFADAILRKLARKEIFPNLRVIVVAGHSAGGQFVTRYEMANQVHDTLGVPVTYVVSNPSSYAYPDAARPAPTAAAASEFRDFSDARNCTTYDHWPYGLQGRTGYAAQLTGDQLKKQLAARPVTYLLGEIDILPLGGFDTSCPAMAQGSTRLERGLAFVRYMNQRYGAHHHAAVVPLCGHNARCMFTAETALPILFPKP